MDVPHLLVALVREPRIGASLLGPEGLSEDLLLRQFRPRGAAAASVSAPAPPPSPAPVDPAPPLLADAWIDTAAPVATAPPPTAPATASPAAPTSSDELRLEQGPAPVSSIR
jgi:hypothetical protein